MVFKGAGRKSSPLLRAACRHSTQSGQVSAAASKAVMTAEDLSLAAKKHKHRMNVLLQHKLYKDKKHPVYNFLFTYVFINEKNLFRYTPGVDTVVSGISYRGIIQLYRRTLEYKYSQYDVFISQISTGLCVNSCCSCVFAIFTS